MLLSASALKDFLHDGAVLYTLRVKENDFHELSKLRRTH